MLKGVSKRTRKGNAKRVASWSEIRGCRPVQIRKTNRFSIARTVQYHVIVASIQIYRFRLVTRGFVNFSAPTRLLTVSNAPNSTCTRFREFSQNIETSTSPTASQENVTFGSHAAKSRHGLFFIIVAARRVHAAARVFCGREIDFSNVALVSRPERRVIRIITRRVCIKPLSRRRHRKSPSITTYTRARASLPNNNNRRAAGTVMTARVFAKRVEPARARTAQTRARTRFVHYRMFLYTIDCDNARGVRV